MNSQADISVIVVSRDRPDELRKMLACLRFQDISGFEVIVVTNTPGALDPSLQPARLRVFDCDEANISVARNVGIAAANGRYLAFCDDDALPDPSWLRLLLEPFENPDVGGVGGFTRGRNGISLQWGAVETDRLGVAYPLDISQYSEPVVFSPSEKSAPVMIGTNCAFRRKALRQIGGFDPGFAYFLDDSDISLRLSQEGWSLAIVPLAQVHHGFAAGPYRTRNRVPKTLEPHGKSKAYFCRKHATEQELEPALYAFKDLQFGRLEKQMLAGLMEPHELPKLMVSLEKGYKTGGVASLTARPNTGKPVGGPEPKFTRKKTPHVMLVGRKSNLDWMNTIAETLSRGEVMVTVLVLSRNASFMQINFSRMGFWIHKGGQFGKSGRNEPEFRCASIAQKVRREVERMAPIRPVDLLVYPERAIEDDTILPQTGVMSCLNEFVVESV